MKIRINRKVFNDVYIPALENKSRYLVLYGGAGSGKSYFVAQKILIRMLRERGHRFLVIRKVKATLRRSVYAQILDVINRFNWNALFTTNKTEMTITCINGSEIYFAGLDDPEKIKSITGITSIWIEEATELRNITDFQEIDRRLRGNFKNYKQIILTFNGISETLWHARFVKRKDNILVLNTTYKDNKFIDEEYKKILESYTGNARRVYTEGKFGKLEHAVFHNWDIVSKFPDTDKYVYGVDFGYSHPKAVVKVYEREKDLYLQEIIYQRNLKTSDMIQMLHDKSVVYYCDSEDPEAIEAMREAGFMAISANKKGGSRISSINKLLNYNIHIVEGSTNVIKEFQLCQRKTDRFGNVYEDIEKQNDHAIDAVRYAIMMSSTVGAVGVL